MIGIFWGLWGAALIGVSDTIARVTAQRVSISVLLAVVMGLSAFVLSIALLAFDAWPKWHIYAWSVSCGAGALNVVALIFIYKAMARGPVTVASPAASCFSIILVTLNALSGAPFVWVQGVAALIVFFGVAMLARHGPSDTTYDAAYLRTTALFGVLAGSTIALRMFWAQEAGEAIGPLGALYLSRLFGFVFVGVAFVWEATKGQTLNWPDRRLWRLVLIQATLETLAFASFLFGSEGIGRVGASIGFSAFSAVSAMTAWIWLKEPIGARRAFWMLVVGGGIILAVLAAP